MRPFMWGKDRQGNSTISAGIWFSRKSAQKKFEVIWEARLPRSDSLALQSLVGFGATTGNNKVGEIALSTYYIKFGVPKARKDLKDWWEALPRGEKSTTGCQGLDLVRAASQVPQKPAKGRPKASLFAKALGLPCKKKGTPLMFSEKSAKKAELMLVCQGKEITPRQRIGVERIAGLQGTGSQENQPRSPRLPPTPPFKGG